jgi:hypothetical protein
MGWGVRIPFFSKIGNLRNFSLYTAKIVFFGQVCYLIELNIIKKCKSFAEKYEDRKKQKLEFIEGEQGLKKKY